MGIDIHIDFNIAHILLLSSTTDATAIADAGGYLNGLTEAISEADAEAIAKCAYPRCKGRAKDCCSGEKKPQCGCNRYVTVC